MNSLALISLIMVVICFVLIGLMFKYPVEFYDYGLAELSFYVLVLVGLTLLKLFKLI